MNHSREQAGPAREAANVAQGEAQGEAQNEAQSEARSNEGGQPDLIRPVGPEATGVQIIQDLSHVSSPLDGYLRRHRLRAKTLLSDGTRTDTYVVDYVDRAETRRDAVAVALYAQAQEIRPHDPARSGIIVLLRNQLRYPVYLVEGRALFTEVVAGLIEKPESPEEATVREVLEETGLDIHLEEVKRLGPPVYPTPGILTERFHPMAVKVSPESLLAAQYNRPDGDGSPMEEGASMFIIALDAAIAAGMNGPTPKEATYIRDAKTEIVLRRLRDHLNGL